jgi:hypothetical protein
MPSARSPSRLQRTEPVIPPAAPSLRIPWSLLGPYDHATAWRGRRWHRLQPLDRRRPCPPTRVSLLAAADGLHARFICTSRRITAEMRDDGAPLYLQDVVELFAWPSPGDVRAARYLEHEVSPAGSCLTLIIASDGRPRARWTPWGLAPADRPRQRVTIRRQHGRVCGWDVDVVLPWTLFTGLGVVPPVAGSCWRGNLTRIDHAQGGERFAAWSLPPVVDFHRLDALGEWCFEAPPSAPRTRRRSKSGR